MDADDVLRRHNRVTRQLRNAETEKDKLAGRIEQLTKELSTLGFDSIAKAEKWIIESEQRVEELGENILSKLKKVEVILDDLES